MPEEAFKYINYQNKKPKIRISDSWYMPDKKIWGDRYMDEKKDILNKSRNKKEISIIRKYIKRGGRVLDIPCGYGRLSNILAGLGYRVTGVDINKYFINIAKKEAEKKKLKPNYFVKDINSFKTKIKYDAVLNIYTSLGYYGSDAENEKTIELLCSWVKSGGKLIIELINPYKLINSNVNIRRKKTKTATRIKFEDYFDYLTSTNLTKITECFADNKVSSSSTRIRIYFPHELINLCHKHGLNLDCILNDKGKKEKIMESSRLWYIFKKF